MYPANAFMIAWPNCPFCDGTDTVVIPDSSLTELLDPNDGSVSSTDSWDLHPIRACDEINRIANDRIR